MPGFRKDRWPATGAVRALLEYLDELHRESGQPSYAEIGRAVGLAPSTLSPFFTGTRLVSRGNLELLAEFLGGDSARAERLRKRAATEWNTRPRPAVGAPGLASGRRADLRELTGVIEREAMRTGLPRYLPPGSDPLRLHQAIRVSIGLREHTWPGQVSGQAHDGVAAPAVSWTELLASHRRVMLLGDAGLGKSWLVRTETVRLARAAGRAVAAGSPTDEVLVPVVVRADEAVSAGAADFEEALLVCLASRYHLSDAAREALSAQLAAGSAVVMIDALDELPDRASRARLEQLLAPWADSTANILVVTSRTAGYTGPPMHTRGVAEAELQPFTAQDVDALVGAWGLPAAAETALRERLERDPVLASLARVPLMLCLLCALADDGQELPHQRSAIHDRVLRRFLSSENRWPSVPTAEPVEVDRYIGVLAPLAYRFASSPEGWVDSMSARRIIGELRSLGPALEELGLDAVSALRELSITAGILVPAGSQREGRDPPYLFAHRTIAEHLVAIHLSQWPEADLESQIFHDLWLADEWRPTVITTGALLARQGRADVTRRFVTALLEQRDDPFHLGLFTAARILTELPDPSIVPAAERAAICDRLLVLLTQRVDQEPTLEFLETYLASLPEEFIKAVLDLLQSGEESVRASAAVCLLAVRSPEVTAALAGLLRQPGLIGSSWTRVADSLLRNGRSEAVDGLLDLLDDPITGGLLGLGEVLASTSDERVTGRALARLSAASPAVRVNAAAALESRHDDPEVVTHAVRLAAEDDELAVRLSALEILTRSSDPRATAALRSLSLDPLTVVADHAAKAIAAESPGHSGPGADAADAVPPAVVLPETPAELVALLDDENRRFAAALQLRGTGGADTARALAQALSSPDPATVLAAVIALGGNDTDDALVALMGQITHERLEVRQAALDGLADLSGRVRGHQAVRLADGLASCLEDPDPFVASGGVRALPETAHPRIIDTLIRCACDERSQVAIVAGKKLAKISHESVVTRIAQHLEAGHPDAGEQLYWAAEMSARKAWPRLPEASRREIKRALGAFTRSLRDLPASVLPRGAFDQAPADPPDPQGGARNPKFDTAEPVTLLIRGRNLNGQEVYSYIRLPLYRVRNVREALKSGAAFVPGHYGEVLAAGRGHPSPEVVEEIGRNQYMIYYA